MSPELITAVASVVTAVVIGATAIAAVIQLRHMRVSNQFTALLTVQSEFDAKDFRDAIAMVRKEFPQILDDEDFCAYFIAVLKNQEPIENSRYEATRKAARFVGNTYETLGLLMKKGIVEKDLFLDAYGWPIVNAWSDLDGFVAMIRAGTGERTIFENFEYVASIARDYQIEHPELYPRQVKRLQPRLPAAAAKLLKE